MFVCVFVCVFVRVAMNIVFFRLSHLIIIIFVIS
jgi:hypothetical protein